MFSLFKKVSRPVTHIPAKIDPRFPNIESLNEFKKILIVDWNDKECREWFQNTLNENEISHFSQILDWRKDAEGVAKYIADGWPRNFSHFPVVAVLLPKERTFSKEDQVALLSPKRGHYKDFTFKVINDESNWQMCEALIQEKMVPEFEQVKQVKLRVLQQNTIKTEHLGLILACNHIEELKIVYARLAQEGKIEALNPIVLQELEENYKLKIPAKVELVPAEPVMEIPQEAKAIVDKFMEQGFKAMIWE